MRVFLLPGGFRLLYSHNCQFGQSQWHAATRTTATALSHAFPALAKLKLPEESHVTLVNEGIVEEIMLPPLHMVHATLPGMRAQRAGAIVVVATDRYAAGTVADNDDDEWARVLNINVIGIGIDSPSNIAEFTTRLKISYPIYVAGMSGTELSRQFGLAVDPTALISEITVGQQQRVDLVEVLRHELRQHRNPPECRAAAGR